MSVWRLRRPAQRPGHQASTAHVQAAYPAVTEAGLGSRGVVIGRDAYGGSFVFDPWVLYGEGVLTNANTIVFGHVGFAKSALTKCMLLRQRVFGRQVEIIDPKGEYLPLVHAIGGVVLRLAPGGTVRLNPLTRLGSREMREGLLEAVTRAMLARPLTQAEALGLAAALRAADQAQGDGETCIPHVIEQLRTPTDRAADVLGMTQGEARVQLRECALALRRLCEGPLRGMFDGPTTTGEHTWDAPAVALDLSALAAGRVGTRMVSGTPWMTSPPLSASRKCSPALTASLAAWLSALMNAGVGSFGSVISPGCERRDVAPRTPSHGRCGVATRRRRRWRAIKVLVGGHVAAGGAWIGVAHGVLDVLQRDAGVVEADGERVAHAVRAELRR
jgi:hypothetical protein